MRTLKEARIKEIVNNSTDIYNCLLNLYKEILPVSWDDIETLKPWGIRASREINECIIKLMHEKYSKDADPWNVNGLILNKGFGTDDIPAWKYRLTPDCYTLKAKQNNLTH